MDIDARDNHTSIPSRPDLIRLGVGIIGIGTSGPLIALSTMPVLTLIAWRNLGGALLTAPFALRHKVDRKGALWSMIAGVVLAAHFLGFFLAMRMTSVAAGTALVALQPIFAALFVKTERRPYSTHCVARHDRCICWSASGLWRRSPPFFSILFGRPSIVDFSSASSDVHDVRFACTAHS